MDILVDGVIFGLQPSGGISRFWAELLLDLDASCFKVGVLIPTNQNVEWQLIQPQLKHVQVIKRRRFRWKKTSTRLDSLYLSAIHLTYRPKVWHSSYYVGMPLNGGHRIISYHDMIPEKTQTVDVYEQQQKYHSLKKAHIILSPSTSAKEDLLALWPECHNVTVIPRGIPEFKTEEVETAYPYLLYVGKREGYKSFTPVVTQLLEDPRFHAYHILAIGGESQTTVHHPRLHYLGTLPYPTVLGYMQKSAALLFPSLYEGFGLPVLEAFAMQTPVLARHTSSIPEITGSEYPLVKNNQFGDTLQQLLEHRSYWVNYGSSRAQLFSRQTAWEGYLSLYTDLLNK